MMRIFPVVIIPLLLIHMPANGDPISYTIKNNKQKNEYKFSKCIDGATYYRQKLTYDEICKYGTNCPEHDAKVKVLMYCMYPNLSTCFENKAWKTANELVGLQKKHQYWFANTRSELREWREPK